MYAMCVCMHVRISVSVLLYALTCVRLCEHIFFNYRRKKRFLFVDDFCSQGTHDDLLVVHSSHSFIGQASCEGFGGPFQTHVDCAKPCTDKANITVTSNNFLTA